MGVRPGYYMVPKGPLGYCGVLWGTVGYCGVLWGTAWRGACTQDRLDWRNALVDPEPAYTAG
jgi:hypothetical protein